MQNHLDFLYPKIKEKLNVFFETESSEFNSFLASYFGAFISLVLTDEIVFRKIIKIADKVFPKGSLTRQKPNVIFKCLTLLGDRTREIVLSKLENIPDFAYLGLLETLSQGKESEFLDIIKNNNISTQNISEFCNILNVFYLLNDYWKFEKELHLDESMTEEFKDALMSKRFNEIIQFYDEDANSSNFVQRLIRKIQSVVKKDEHEPNKLFKEFFEYTIYRNRHDNEFVYCLLLLLYDNLFGSGGGAVQDCFSTFLRVEQFGYNFDKMLIVNNNLGRGPKGGIMAQLNFCILTAVLLGHRLYKDLQAFLSSRMISFYDFFEQFVNSFVPFHFSMNAKKRTAINLTFERLDDYLGDTNSQGPGIKAPKNPAGALKSLCHIYKDSKRQISANGITDLHKVSNRNSVNELIEGDGEQKESNQCDPVTYQSPKTFNYNKHKINPSQLLQYHNYKVFQNTTALAKYAKDNSNGFDFFIDALGNQFDYIKRSNTQMKAFARTITGMAFDGGTVKVELLNRKACCAVVYLAQCGVIDVDLKNVLNDDLFEIPTPTDERPKKLTKWGQAADPEFINLVHKVFGRLDGIKKPKNTTQKGKSAK